METTLVIDFSSNTLSATVEQQTQVDSFVSAITPNNYLALLDFLKHNKGTALPDFVDEIDYSVAEY